MSKKEFNISEWLPTENLPPKTTEVSSSQSPHNFSSTNQEKPPQSFDNDTELILQRIEEQHIDITGGYSNWRDIGFALADEHGSMGRDYFHRVSRFNSDYAFEECDKQFDKCLRSKGSGININTFYYLAKQGGINIATAPAIKTKVPQTSRSIEEPSESGFEDQLIFQTPHIDAEVYSNLPAILKESADLFNDPIEKDVFLIGVITTLSGCLPNIEGIYFDEPYSAHLYAFITAPAGSGKGKLKWAKFFGQLIHKTIVEQSGVEKETYDMIMEQYNNMTKNERKNVEKPKAPKHKMFFIPANSSASAFIQALSDNDFKGVLFETEADTLTGTLKQDWGNFSDVLRKAFHHESTNMFRRKDNEHIEVEDPHLAIMLSGTPKQVHNMMPDVENGLFSRFLYYAFEDYSDFKNPFISHRPVNYVEFFQDQGRRIFELYQKLNKMHKPIRFSLTEEQGHTFTEDFNTLYKRNRLLLGNDFNANSRRLGLITFRMAMILSALRAFEQELPLDNLVCNSTDYETAISLAFTLEKHAIAVYQNLPNNQLQGLKQKFFNKLPDEFNRQDYLTTASEMDIKPKTAEKYISQFRTADLLTHEHNLYQKAPQRK
ncbi:MAG: DUF3987 domain-containing protein [Bacteroidetes bacterium]|nr:DUF3987 domain-containing protein [Bacteroidota bacterium]